MPSGGQVALAAPVQEGPQAGLGMHSGLGLEPGQEGRYGQSEPVRSRGKEGRDQDVLMSSHPRACSRRHIHRKQRHERTQSVGRRGCSVVDRWHRCQLPESRTSSGVL